VDRNGGTSVEVVKRELRYNPPVILAGGLKEDPDVAGMTKAFKAIVLSMFIETKGGFNPAAGLNQNRGPGVGT
jgi:hypothetical protein